MKNIKLKIKFLDVVGIVLAIAILIGAITFKVPVAMIMYVYGLEYGISAFLSFVLQSIVFIIQCLLIYRLLSKVEIGYEIEE